MVSQSLRDRAGDRTWMLAKCFLGLADARVMMPIFLLVCMARCDELAFTMALDCTP